MIECRSPIERNWKVTEEGGRTIQGSRPQKVSGSKQSWEYYVLLREYGMDKWKVPSPGIEPGTRHLTSSQAKLSFEFQPHSDVSDLVSANRMLHARISEGSRFQDTE